MSLFIPFHKIYRKQLVFLEKMEIERSKENPEQPEHEPIDTAINLMDNGMLTLKLVSHHLKDFSSIQKNPNLESLILDNNDITSFLGAASQPKLKFLSIQNNPISSETFLNVMCSIVFGENLINVNGKEISAGEIQLGKEVAEFTYHFLTKGFLIKNFNPLTLEHAENNEVITMSITPKRSSPKSKISSSKQLSLNKNHKVNHSYKSEPPLIPVENTKYHHKHHRHHKSEFANEKSKKIRLAIEATTSPEKMVSVIFLYTTGEQIGLSVVSESTTDTVFFETYLSYTKLWN